MPTYTSNADPYWQQRKLAGLSQAIASLRQAKDQKASRRLAEEDALIAEAAAIAGRVGTDDPRIFEIKGRLSKEGQSRLDAALRAAPDAAAYNAKVRADKLDNENFIAQQQAMQSFLGLIGMGGGHGADFETNKRAALDMMPPEQRLLIEPQLRNMGVRGPFTPQEMFSSMDPRSRSDFMGLGGQVPGSPPLPMPPDFTQAVRHRTKLDRTPEQLQRSSERARTAGTQEFQAGTSRMREERLASGGKEEKPETKTEFIRRRQKELLDDNKRLHAEDEDIPVLTNAAARQQATKEWRDQQRVEEYVAKWGPEYGEDVAREAALKMLRAND